MALDASHAGTVPFGSHETWYRVTGDLDGGAIPLVVLHGGPGAAHDYLLNLANLAAAGRPVIHYDQVGCGRSTHLRGRGADFWTVQLFLDELANLLDALCVDRYHLLGQSWGGMLAAEHAVNRPAGLASLVISNSPASMDLWVAEAKRLRRDLPAGVRETLDRHEADNTTDDPAYVEATQVFYDRHVCRVIPNPPEVLASMAQVADDPTVYQTMNGPNEFLCIGSLRTWSIIDRLDRIDAPTLLASGHFDEATPAVVQPFFDRIDDVRWEIFQHSSHMPFIEETERYLEVVGDFLAQHD